MVLPGGRNILKMDGYFSINFWAVVGRWRWGFRGETVERGIVWKGCEMIRVFSKSKGLRFFSFSMAVSRYGSRTHLILAFIKVRINWR